MTHDHINTPTEPITTIQDEPKQTKKNEVNSPPQKYSSQAGLQSFIHTGNIIRR